MNDGTTPKWIAIIVSVVVLSFSMIFAASQRATNAEIKATNTQLELRINRFERNTDDISVIKQDIAVLKAGQATLEKYLEKIYSKIDAK
jgi:cell division protein FtsB